MDLKSTSLFIVLSLLTGILIVASLTLGIFPLAFIVVVYLCFAGFYINHKNTKETSLRYFAYCILPILPIYLTRLFAMTSEDYGLYKLVIDFLICLPYSIAAFVIGIILMARSAFMKNNLFTAYNLIFSFALSAIIYISLVRNW